MWCKFRRHRLAMAGGIVILGFYLIVIFADFFAYSDPDASEAQRGLLSPQTIHFFDNGRFSPHVYAITGQRDPQTFKRVYKPDPNTRLPELCRYPKSL